MQRQIEQEARNSRSSNPRSWGSNSSPSREIERRQRDFEALQREVDAQRESQQMVEEQKSMRRQFEEQKLRDEAMQRSMAQSARPSPAATETDSHALEAADAALQKLDRGQMAFDVPENLRLDETAVIHLLLSPDRTVEQLTAAVQAEATEPVRVESAQLQVSELMEARLVGASFDIHPITPEEPQMVSRAAPTEWKWEIQPRHAGRQSLHLTVNAIIRYDGKERTRAMRTFDRVIRVDVAPGAPRWMWPAAGLATLAALGGTLTLARRRRTGGPRPAGAARPAAGASVDVFLSYSRRDEARVFPLAEQLRARGLTLWIDQQGIDGATLWAEEISEAIRRAKVCLLFASASSLQSPHVTREVSLACEERKPILPLHLEPVEIPSAMRYQLAGIQHIALYQGRPEANLESILRALARLGVGQGTHAGPNSIPSDP